MTSDGFGDASPVQDLIDAVVAMRAAGDDTKTSLEAAGVVCDDIPVIRAQIERASVTVTRLREILLGPDDHDEVFVLLHQINNQLTGILSLTLLVMDDLAADHPSRPTLDCLDQVSRDAAAVVKKVAAALRSNAA